MKWHRYMEHGIVAIVVLTVIAVSVPVSAYLLRSLATGLLIVIVVYALARALVKGEEE